MSTSNSPAIVVGVHSIIPGNFRYGAAHALGLYKEKQFCSLPPLPVARGIRSQGQMISVNRAIYVLGGLEHQDRALATQEVYSFDLASEAGNWRKCSNMRFPRLHFGVGTLHGNIYVFGGYNCGKPVLECEVYDPKVNSWSTLPAMPQPRVNHKVAALGEQFYIYGGRAGTDSASEDLDHVDKNVDVCKSTILVYDLKEGGKWFTWDEADGGKGNLINDNLFVVNECFHRLTRDGIDRYNVVENSWTTLQSFVGLWDGSSFSDIPDDLDIGSGGHTILVGNELLTVSHFKRNGETERTPEGACLLQTLKFGTEEKDIVLEIAQCSLGRFENGSTQIFLIDL